MKNKFLIGVITVFSAIFVSILILNFLNSSSNNDNYFERKFSKNEILIFHKKYEKLDKKSIYELYYSNTSIIEGSQKNIGNNKKTYNLNFSDLSFSNKNKLSINLPIDSNVLFIDSNWIIYSSKSKLYKYDIINKNIIETKIKNVDISFLISLDNVSNKYLFFGEIFRNNSYKSGFFILDILENKILDSKILQTNAKSYKPETVVEHCGYFQKAEINSISYTCDKNSKIFIFNGKGLFLNELNTNDNTSLPKVIKNANNECYYSRAGLKFTNAGLFMADNNIYVFSMASKEKDKIIIDQYSKLNMKYIQSFKLNYNNYCSSDIVNVYIKQDMIILKFETNYASFKFSRYI